MWPFYVLLSKRSNLKVRMMPTLIAIRYTLIAKTADVLQFGSFRLGRDDPFFQWTNWDALQIAGSLVRAFFWQIDFWFSKLANCNPIKSFIIMEKKTPEFGLPQASSVDLSTCKSRNIMKSHTPNRQKPPARSIKGQRVLQLSPVDLEIIFTTTPCLDLAAGSPNKS